jgi:hypothetical protein
MTGAPPLAGYRSIARGKACALAQISSIEIDFM